MVGEGLINATPKLLYPKERALSPIVQETGWTPWLVWMDREKRKSLDAVRVLHLRYK
jgi:hypothetical protein